MFRIEIQLSKERFQKPPTKIIHERLLSEGLIQGNHTYRAEYHSKTGKLIILVDENQVNAADISLESRNYSKSERHFKNIRGVIMSGIRRVI